MAFLEFLTLGWRAIKIPLPVLTLQLLLLSWLPLPKNDTYFILTVSCSLLFRRHYFLQFGLALHLTLNAHLKAINLLLGLTLCRTPLLTVLYLYIAGRLLLLERTTLAPVYSLIAGAVLLGYLYRRVPAAAAEVRGLFQAMSVVWMQQGIELVRVGSYSTDSTYLAQLLLLLPLTYLASAELMNRRLHNLSRESVLRVKHASEALVYIEFQKDSLLGSVDGLGFELSHRQECRSVDCFCRDTTNPSSRCFYEAYIVSLYERFFEGFRELPEKHAVHCSLVEFLIEKGLVLAAVERNIQFRERFRLAGLFCWLEQKRVDRMLQRQVELNAAGDNFNSLVRELHSYERNFQELRERVRQLLALKISYWQELCQPACRVQRLRSLADEFLGKFNRMNQFYLGQLKETELRAGLLMGGVVYNLFLLVATNYKNLSDDNIKELRKHHESASGQLTIRKKYYCITASLRGDRAGIIENHSHNLCEFVSGSKSSSPTMLVGTSIEQLIPKPYLPMHQAGFRGLKRRPNAHLIGGDYLNLFLLSTANRILPCQIQVEYCASLINELSVVALIKKENSEGESMLLDGCGSHLYSSCSEMLHLQLLEQGKFKQALQKYRQTDRKEPAKVSLSYGRSVFYLSLSSPHLRAFQEFGAEPPIYVQLADESNSRMVEKTFGEEMINAAYLSRLNRLIGMVEESSQTSEISRPNEVISFLKAFQVGPTIKIFQLLFLIITLANLLAVALASLHFLSIQLDSITLPDSSLNHFLVERTLLQVQQGAARVISKGLSLFAIESGQASEALVMAGYRPDLQNSTTYSSLARSQVETECDALRVILADKLALKNDSMGQALSSQVSQQQNISTRTSTQLFSLSGALRKLVSDCYDLSAGVPFSSLVSGEIYWQTLFPGLFALLSRITSVNLQEIDRYLTMNRALMATGVVLLFLLILPVYITIQKITREERFVYELMAGLDSEQIRTETGFLMEFQQSLKLKTADATCQLDRIGEDEQQNEEQLLTETAGEQLMLRGEEAARRRSGLLDYAGSERHGTCLYLLMLVYVVLLVCNFQAKQLVINQLLEELQANSQASRISNQRVHILLNLKKQFYGWQTAEPIGNTSALEWNSAALSQRRINYELNQSADGTRLGSSLQSVNYNFLNLASESLAANTSDYLPYMQYLQETSSRMQSVSQPLRLEQWFAAERVWITLSSALYYCNYLALLLCGALGLREVHRMKEGFIMMVRSLSFLNEEMIRNSKRVHGFMQRMSKEQQ